MIDLDVANVIALDMPRPAENVVANALRPQLHARARTLGKFLAETDKPEPIEQRSLTSHKEKLIEIKAKFVNHGSYASLQMPRSPFLEICSQISCG